MQLALLFRFGKLLCSELPFTCYHSERDRVGNPRKPTKFCLFFKLCKRYDVIDQHTNMYNVTYNVVNRQLSMKISSCRVSSLFAATYLWWSKIYQQHYSTFLGYILKLQVFPAVKEKSKWKRFHRMVRPTSSTCLQQHYEEVRFMPHRKPNDQ